MSGYYSNNRSAQGQAPYVSKAHDNLVPYWTSEVKYQLANGEPRVAHFELYDYSEASTLLSAEPEFFNSFQDHLKGVGAVGYRYKVPHKAGCAISKKQFQTPRVQAILNGIMSGTVKAHPSNYNPQHDSSSQPNMQPFGNRTGFHTSYGSQPSQPQQETSAMSMLDQLRGGPPVTMVAAPSQSSMPASAPAPAHVSQPLVDIPGIPRAPPSVDAALATLLASVNKCTSSSAFTVGGALYIAVTYDNAIIYSPEYDFVIENSSGMSLMKKKKEFNIPKIVNSIKEQLSLELPAGQIAIYGTTYIWDTVEANAARKTELDSELKWSMLKCSLLIRDTASSQSSQDPLSMPSIAASPRGELLFDLHRAMHVANLPQFDSDGIAYGSYDSVGIVDGRNYTNSIFFGTNVLKTYDVDLLQL